MTRPIRDRLGEALWRAMFGDLQSPWSDLAGREGWREKADDLIATAAKVGLTIGGETDD